MKSSLHKAVRALTLAAIVACALFGAAAVSAQSIKILPRDAVWSYEDGGMDLGSAWRTADFYDSGWKRGKAPLGFGDDVSETDPKLPIGTIVGFGPNPEDKTLTTYMRTTVEVADPGAFTALSIYVHADDGAVVYINGMEAFRRGIATGVEVSYSTSAKFKPKEETFTIPASILKKGKNLIAAEVHQDDGQSSDLWFEMGIDGVMPPSAVVLPRNAVWKYEDSGKDLGTTWRASGFADSVWKKGKAPLGFGDGVSETDPNLPIGTVVGFGPNPEDKTLTTYMRTEVEVGDLSAFDTLKVYVHADDGAVVYINGTEAFRRGIADGVSVSYATSAKFKPKEENFTIPLTLLKQGRNVIAAEVHQDDGQSSDLWFELGLVAVSSKTTSTAAPKSAVVLVPDPAAPLGVVTKAVATPFGDAKTSFGMTWYTTTVSDRSDLQVVEKKGTSPDFSAAKTFSGAWSLSEQAPGAVIHKAAATGLLPGATYWYRVGDASRKLWSESGVYRTAPKSGAFTFIDLADSQAKSEDEAILSAKTFATATATVQDASFMAINGDLVDVGMVEQQWDWLFGHAAPTLRSLPFVPAAGNHDEDQGSFINHFNVSHPAKAPVVSGAYYSFDWSNAHFIVLNTNEDSPEYADLTPAQVAWFSDDAKAAKKAGANWIVVFIHKGPYTTSNHATDKDMTDPNGIRTKFAPMLDDLGVDLVLQGHDHIYARSLPIKDGTAVPAAVRTETVSGSKVQYAVDPQGPIYVIPSTAGPKVYYRNKKIDPSYFKLFAVADEQHAAKYGPDPADASRPLRGSVQNFMGITIDGKKLTAFTYELDDKVNGGKPFIIDSFGIIKK